MRASTLWWIAALLVSGFTSARASNVTGTVLMTGYGDTPALGPEWTWRIDFVGPFDWTGPGEYRFSGTPPGSINSGEYYRLLPCASFLDYLNTAPCVYGIQATFPEEYGAHWGADGAAIQIRDGRLVFVVVACGGCDWRWSEGASTRWHFYGGVSGPVTGAQVFVTPEPGTLWLGAAGAVVGLLLKRRYALRFN